MCSNITNSIHLKIDMYTKVDETTLRTYTCLNLEFSYIYKQIKDNNK